MKKLVSILIFLWLTGSCAWAQDTLAPLVFSEGIRSETQHDDASGARDINRPPFVYIIDTLPIPFFDDFSKNRVKVYDAKIDDENVSLRILADFEVNGEALLNVDLIDEPTFSIVKPVDGPLEYEENDPLHIVYFDSAGAEIGYDTGWANIISKIDVGTGTITFDTLEADTTLTNNFDTLYLVADDNSFWVTPGNEANRGGAYINNVFAANALTQGVATFDGTDALGVPYDISSETAYGPADTLESKPFELLPEMTDVYLSFFYQAGGLGNAPDEEDSLIVEFYNVADKKWQHAWSTAGSLDINSAWNERIWLNISSPDFLLPGFRFRFRNYATLSGILDQWHIDYIELGAERDPNLGDSIQDVAFITPISSFTGRFTSVPYKHYLESPSSFQEDTVKAFIRNLGDIAVNILNLDYEIKSPAGTVVDEFSTLDPRLDPFELRQYGFIQDSEQIFPDLDEEFVQFDVKSWFNISGGNLRRENDTISSVQTFYNHYSYDDGSAETAYSLRGAGAELAYQFNTPVGDSLKAIYFNFPQTLNDDAEDFEIVLTVWDDTASDPIFIADYFSIPQYTNANSFVRYELNPPVYVEGDFLVGFQQQQEDKLFIGYDLNNDASDKLFYRVNDVWFQASFAGALMMRPDFGKESLLKINESETDAQTDIMVFPNPTAGVINLLKGKNYKQIELFDLQGNKVFQTTDCAAPINVGYLSDGIYLIRATNHSAEVSSQKVIISHQ